jgi:hypothetical protein
MIARRAGDLAHAKASINNLRQHLIVEHEIVGISVKRKVLENSARKAPITCMEFGELMTYENVLDKVSSLFAMYL